MANQRAAFPLPANTANTAIPANVPPSTFYLLLSTYHPLLAQLPPLPDPLLPIFVQLPPSLAPFLGLARGVH